jgi:hypothetical protein
LIEKEEARRSEGPPHNFGRQIGGQAQRDRFTCVSCRLARSDARRAASERQSGPVGGNKPAARLGHRLDDGNQRHRSNDLWSNRLHRQESAREARVFTGAGGAFTVVMRCGGRFCCRALGRAVIVAAAVVVQKMHAHRCQQVG